VGGLKYFEIWDKEKWEEEFEKTKAGFPAAIQSIKGLGVI
jgi:MraZ protein